MRFMTNVLPKTRRTLADLPELGLARALFRRRRYQELDMPGRLLLAVTLSSTATSWET